MGSNKVALLSEWIRWKNNYLQSLQKRLGKKQFVLNSISCGVTMHMYKYWNGLSDTAIAALLAFSQNVMPFCSSSELYMNSFSKKPLTSKDKLEAIIEITDCFQEEFEKIEKDFEELKLKPSVQKISTTSARLHRRSGTESKNLWWFSTSRNPWEKNEGLQTEARTRLNRGEQFLNILVSGRGKIRQTFEKLRHRTETVSNDHNESSKRKAINKKLPPLSKLKHDKTVFVSKKLSSTDLSTENNLLIRKEKWLLELPRKPCDSESWSCIRNLVSTANLLLSVRQQTKVTDH